MADVALEPEVLPDARARPPDDHPPLNGGNPPTRPLTRTTLNLLSNYAGSFVGACLGIVTVPVYIAFMGISAYGLVGFYAALQAILSLLDIGLSTSLNRELAQLTAGDSSPQAYRDVVRTLEWLYWGLAAVLGAAVVAAAPFLSSHWIRGGGLPRSSIHSAVVLMGIAIALEFPFVLYAGGLMGLQKQLSLNISVVAFSVVRAAGSILVLAFVSPTIEAFLVWQAAISLLQSGVTGLLLWKSLPRASDRSRFQPAILRRLSRFSVQLAGTGVLTALLTQLPKLELGNLLSLAQLGFFSLATLIATGLYFLVTPVFQAIFPRFTQLVVIRDDIGLSTLYHRSCQIVSVAVFPIALVLILFPQQVLFVWTGNQSIANHAALLLALAVIGTTLHTLLWIPYALQLASNWAALALYQNAVGVVILVPLTYILATHYGAVGASIAWIALNVGSVGITMQIMYRRLLPREKIRWYLHDVLAPVVAPAIVVIAAWTVVQLGDLHGSPLRVGAFLAMVLCVGQLAAVWSLPLTRGYIRALTPFAMTAIRRAHVVR